ncbi:MAG: hypothetical protein ABI950_09940 [Solirubrobacteraceae bacterium]
MSRSRWGRSTAAALALATTTALAGAAAAAAATPVEGMSFAGLTVSAPAGCNAQPAPAIDWGDGGPASAGTCADFNHVATGPHTYARAGHYSGVAGYTSPNGPRTSPFTVDVADAALTGAPVAISATAGTAFSGPVAHFTDANPQARAADFSATVTWGDGATSAGSVSADGGGFGVTATHTYAASGHPTVSVAIQDAGGATATVTESADVAAAASAGQTTLAAGDPTIPPATAAFTPSAATAGHVVADAGASRPPGAVVTSYAWNLDGHTGPHPSALCGPGVSQLSARLAAGTHTLTLAVTGSGGQVTTVTHQFVVARTGPPRRTTVRAAASAALTQVFVCSPGPGDHPGDPTAGGGPPAGCATEVQFGLADAVGCLNRITSRSDWPGAENKIFQHLIGSLSTQNCQVCAGAAAAGRLSLLAFEDGVMAHQDPFVSTRTVRINGIDFAPRPGAAIVLLPDQNIVLSANASMSLGGVPIQSGLVELYVPRGHGSAGTVHIDDYKLSEQAKRIGLGSFPFDGSIGLDFAYHRSQLPVHVTLPNVFTLGDGDAIEGAVTLSTDNQSSLRLDSVHVTVPDAFLGPMEIQNLFFDYQREGNAWSGGANIVFPEISLLASPPPPDQGFGIKDGSFDHLGATLAFNPAVELFPGVGLTHIGFTIGLNPTRFSGNVGLNALDVVDVDGSLVGVFASPGAPYTIPADAGAGLEPVAGRRLTSTSFAVGGDTSIVTPVGRIGLGSGYALYQYPDYAEFGGGFFYGFHDIFSIDGHITGFVQVSRRRFDVEGGMHACVAVLGCTGVDAVISSNGIAACWSQPILFAHIDVGFGYHWGDSLPDIYLLGCDIGPYTAHAARAAQAGGARTVTIPAGLPFANVRVRGSGDAPRVTLTGPNGERVETPATENLADDARFVLVRQPQSDTTFIGIRHPAAGTWTITAQADSAPVLDVASANGLAAPDVHAQVAGTGLQRTLRYRVTPQPGQQISFAERGPATWRVLGSATSSHGVLRFHPDAGPAGQRQIVALVSHLGLPSREIRVADFHAAAPGAPGWPVHLRVVRTGRRLTVRWGASGGAVRYAVTVDLSDGRRLLFLRRGHVVRLAHVAPSDAVVVRVAGLDATNHHGRAATVRIARAQRPRHPALPRLRA